LLIGGSGALALDPRLTAFTRLRSLRP